MKKTKVPSLKEIEEDWETLADADPKQLAIAKSLREQSRSKRAQKDERMTIRMNGEDMARIVSMAKRAGIPYQTLIGSVLHKFSTNQYVEIAEARKLLGLSKSRPKERKKSS